MITGLYRTHDRLLGHCVRVHSTSGLDAAPIVHVDVYRAMGGHPRYEELPTREAYSQRHVLVPDPLEDG